ncbi:LANO_0H13146g1_1 [Lachancea nothofagi CBS 11611]|uniref:LANO_0H13146g1_1 n=1 Tax=Lachancea nothofagi CBS 11611 TaxID=1266666 RepID=A0A1G4KMH2_9SACH|nr:LANO_0H13146g1_1 [Lachancea nothofagi CBS 11611]
MEKCKNLWSAFYRHKVVQFLISQWFFITLAVFIVLANFFPNFARHGGTIRAEYSIGYGAVAAIFLQSGLSMKTRKLCYNLGNWRAHTSVLTISFLVTSSIMFGLCCAIQKANDPAIDSWVLMGLIVTATCPTTVASNVVMTQKAGGNDLLCLCEVFIGNVLGAFVTPALVQMYTSMGLFEFGNPAAGTSISHLYADVMKQIGLSVFIPLFVGQVLQNVFPKQVSWVLTTFKLNKVGSFCLILIMWSSFSTAFYQRAFRSVSHACIIFVVFFNLGLYLFYTVICYIWARPWFLQKIFHQKPREGSSTFYNLCYRIFQPFYCSKKDSIAIMFCGAAKTAALGVSLVSSQYGSDSPHLGKLLVPLVLYQSEQVMTANLLVPFLKRWASDECEDEDTSKDQDLESGGLSSRQDRPDSHHDSTDSSSEIK